VSEAMHPLKRVGESDEVAAALEFLLHPSNSFITGGCCCRTLKAMDDGPGVMGCVMVVVECE